MKILYLSKGKGIQVNKVVCGHRVREGLVGAAEEENSLCIQILQNVMEKILNIDALFCSSEVVFVSSGIAEALINATEYSGNNLHFQISCMGKMCCS